MPNISTMHNFPFWLQQDLHSIYQFWKQLQPILCRQQKFVYSLQILHSFFFTKQYFSTNQIARMTNFDQSENDKKFSIFSILFLQLCTILGGFCSILRHNSNPLSFQCSQPLYISLHFSFSSFQHRFMKRAGRKRLI